MVLNISKYKAADNPWGSRVKSCHVQHASIIGVSYGEAVRRHPTHYQLGINARRLPVVLESLGGVNLASPSLIVCIDNKCINLKLLSLRIDHWLSTVCTTHRNLW